MIKISQVHVDYMILSLLEQIREGDKKFTQVVGIATGGLYVSTAIAKALGLPHSSVYISLYDGKERRDKPLISGDVPVQPGILVVDDLVNTGGTLRTYDNYFAKDGVAVLYWKEGSYKPDFYAEKKPNDWLVFPWESKCVLKKA